MKKGNKVQDFTLTNTEGREILFSDQFKKEKVLILFFPFAFSSTCTKELCYIRDNLKLFNSLNAKVLAISVDSYYTLREFKKANNLSFPLLSDFNKEISARFGVLNNNFKGMKGVANRAAFIVNENRIIEYAEILDDDRLLPDYKMILKVLEE